MEGLDIDAVVREASSGVGDSKVQATQIIDQLRLEPERWSYGMKFFFESSEPMVRIFGLNLVRDFLMKVPVGTSESVQERQYIRETFLSYIKQTYEACTEEVYIVNNVANVMALVIKHDFPEVWPIAFDDLLSFGALGSAGVTVAVRVLAELDFEVVMFSESRTPDEIRHNSIVKDAMRPLMGTIVQFLTNSAFSEGIVGGQLSALCLNTLSELIGWVDITLTVNDQVLPQIYEAVLNCHDCASDESGHAEAACLCLLEIAKKGMDPVDKVKLLSSVDLVETLARIPFSKDTSNGLEEDLAAVVDVLFLELLGCWQVFESHMNLKANNADQVIAQIQPLSELREVGQLAGQQIKLVMPLIMKILTHSEGRVAATVVPSLNKFIQHMKQQAKYQPQNPDAANPLSVVASNYQDWFFVASDHLNELLAGIFQQLQYSEDFYELYSSTEDIEDDEDVAAEMEAKSQVRKLFVNCCRVYPAVCLEMIQSVFSSLPQPLYTAPFPVLEASLRMFHSFGECGPRNLKQELFPNLVAAIHSSEVYRHQHPLVLMIYYDMTQRYATLVPLDMVQNVVASLVSTQGLRSSDAQLRSRSAYFLRKIVETLRNDAGCLLASTVGSFSDLILTNTSTDDAPLTEQAEMHLLEAVGLMTSAPSAHGKPSQEQLSLLKNMLDILIAQLVEVTQLTEFDPEFIAEIAGRKLSSIAALSKGHSCPKNSAAPSDGSAELFYNATLSIVPMLHAFSPFKPARSKAIMCLHRIIQCVGIRATAPLAELLPSFIRHADVTDIEQPIQVLNQLMAEYGTADTDPSEFAQENLNALMEFLDGLCGLVLDRLGVVYNQIMEAIEEQKATGSVTNNWQEDDDDDSNEGGAQSSLQTEKASIQKLYVTFLQHIAVYGCHPILLSEANINRLPDIFGAITAALQGAGEDSQAAVAATLSVKRPALISLANLTMAWLAAGVTISLEVTGLLVSLLCDVAIPLSFRACSDGSIDVTDAVSQGYLGDIGHLVWAMATVKNKDTVMFLQESLLPSLGWPAEGIDELMAMLAAADKSTSPSHSGNTRVLSNFKDAFKALIRKLHGS
mmetsp:Transcript_17919/g.29970  ORF Transcript_17919/g.29970 Transcript_17919/m.29970 type:complete len:1075 (-) Transcript_17919:108-3332(-)